MGGREGDTNVKLASTSMFFFFSFFFLGGGLGIGSHQEEKRRIFYDHAGPYGG